MKSHRLRSGIVRIKVQKSLETLSLFLLLCVVMLRPLVSESYDSAATPITEALGDISDPSPLRTLIFDAMILLGMLGWLIGRVVGASRSYRKTGLEWGAVLVGVGAIISCVYAGNQRLAINGSIIRETIATLATATPTTPSQRPQALPPRHL